MDYGKLVKRQNNNIGEAEDRFSELPDSILHYILSFIDTKCAARTCVLSQRWNHIWHSIPTLVFHYWKSPSLSEINKFMDFLDRTLLLRDASSNIQKFSLATHKNMNASRSLFKCESLTKLKLSASRAIHIPKSVSFAKLKSLSLERIQFRDDCWKEQYFSDCPFLEKLNLEDCTWSSVRKFCIFTSALKVLNIWNQSLEKDYGLQNCHLKIHAPSMISLTYSGCVAKDYDLSSFPILNTAHVVFDARREHMNAACTLGDENEYDEETEGLCQHLESVNFRAFTGERSGMRWEELILKNSMSLNRMTISYCSFVKSE
ncbi:putative F-box protein At1g58310 [Papaver somniferum]|uniref:putative F-box protein At1g58310 n=1 Tax=Papaver somniferum TaxID=3469 RepID=UPI000E704EBA|nr:putative F-box protein At1g58310 [Papaver somniferum]